MDFCRAAFVCIMMNCCLASIAAADSYVERTIFPTLEDGVDAVPSPIDHTFGKSDSLTVSQTAGFDYKIVIPPDTRCTLSFSAPSTPDAAVSSISGGRIPVSAKSEGNDRSITFTTNPQDSEYIISITSADKEITLSRIKVTLYLKDSNGDGITDLVERLMSPSAGSKVAPAPKPDSAHTAFFYADYFNPGMAAPTDAVQLYYTAMSLNPYIYSTWRGKGYAPQAMLHSRYGHDRPDYNTNVQTDREGRQWGVAVTTNGPKTLDIIVGPLEPGYTEKMKEKYGPGTEVGYDYYHVPTAERTAMAEQYYSRPISAGVTAIGFDEPDYWSETGYSQAFKDEWLKFYGTPWQAPHLNVDSRYHAEKLKAFMEKRHIGTIIAGMKREAPSARTMLAMHSQLNSQTSRFTAAYHDLIQIPELEDIIAEVWMGTSQAPTPLNGKREPRIFELGYLEYSSFYHLTRGTGKQLWFMMDPKEDMPGRAESEYHSSFVPNLLASMMFPAIDNYIPLIWPNRIYGQVSKEYETIINTTTGALCDFWQYKNAKLKSGSKGIATFISDSMGIQLVDPFPADLDGLFGMSLPLISKGVPVEMLSLDRAAEPRYLDKFKVLLLTYEYLKPESPEINKALAKWCKRGGSLIFFNKMDPYCGIKDSWWRKAGYQSPAEHLFDQMGADIRGAAPAVADEMGIRLVLAERPSTRFDISPPYTVTPCPVPVEGSEMLYMEHERKPVVWQRSCGDGNIMYVGVAPAFLASSADGSRLVTSLVRQSMEAAGQKYVERPYFEMERGPYVALRTLDAEYRLMGLYLDLLSPTLTLMEDPAIPPNTCAFLKRFATRSLEKPQIMAASGRTRAVAELADSTSLLVQAPSMTNGVVRMWRGGRDVKEISAFTDRGEKLAADYRVEGETLLIRFPNDSDGVVVRADWE